MVLRLSRHAGWNRFAHDHDQRAGRAGLGAYGGIEAEAAMLGQAVSMLVPQVVGYKLTGKLREGGNSYRPGADSDTGTAQTRRCWQICRVFTDRASSQSYRSRIARPSVTWRPEYGGWTCGIFPVDAGDTALFALDGPQRRTDQTGRGILQRTGSVSTRLVRRKRSIQRHSNWI